MSAETIHAHMVARALSPFRIAHPMPEGHVGIVSFEPHSDVATGEYTGELIGETPTAIKILVAGSYMTFLKRDAQITRPVDAA